MSNRSVLVSLRVMEEIAAHQPIGVSDLARLLGLSKTTAHRALTTLAEAGWIEASGDRRALWSLSVRALMQDRQLQVASVRASADGLLLELDERIKDAVHRGMPVVRILGTLDWGRGTHGWPSDHEILRLEAQVTRAAERLPSIVVCVYDVTNLPGPMLLKGGLECHPLTFRRDCLRHNEHHVSPERFLEEL